MTDDCLISGSTTLLDKL